MTVPPGMPGSSVSPLSLAARPWLTVIAEFTSGPVAPMVLPAPLSPSGWSLRSSGPLLVLASVSVGGPKLLPPSEETVVRILFGL